MLGIQHPSDSTAGFGFSMAGMDIIDAQWVYHNRRKPRDVLKDRVLMGAVALAAVLYLAALLAMSGLFR